MTRKETQGLTAKDFETSQEVRWCPGCGDYAILRSVTKTLADVGAHPDKTAFISGIGCASRFPYYVESYGFHTIHGRAPAIATGLSRSAITRSSPDRSYLLPSIPTSVSPPSAHLTMIFESASLSRSKACNG